MDCDAQARLPLTARTQSFVKGFAEHDVGLGHLPRHVAMLEE